MTDELRLEKNKKIASTQKDTHERRESQVCRVFVTRMEMEALVKDVIGIQDQLLSTKCEDTSL